MVAVALEDDIAGPAHASVEAVPDAHRRTRIACLAAAPWNPYLRLLYEHLAAYGLELVPAEGLTLRWLRDERGRTRFLHFHWPEGHYRFGRGPTLLRPALSWPKLALFALRLAAARRLRFRVVWTIHQVLPHESASGRLDRAGARALGRRADVLVAHDHATADAAERLIRPRRTVHVVRHGSYLGVYPAGRSRAEVRAELGLAPDAFAFLAFGELRAYKAIDLLLAAFLEPPLPGAALVVAGNAKDPRARAAVEGAAAAAVVARLGFVPVERVAELHAACDAAVLARGDGGTSGALLLALSLGLPVVAADCPAYRELLDDSGAGWLFRPGDAVSLRAALAAAAADPAEARRRGAAAFAIAERQRWSDSARELSALLRSTEP